LRKFPWTTVLDLTCKETLFWRRAILLFAKQLSQNRLTPRRDAFRVRCNHGLRCRVDEAGLLGVCLLVPDIFPPGADLEVNNSIYEMKWCSLCPYALAQAAKSATESVSVVSAAFSLV